jgi:PEGA domain
LAILLDGAGPSDAELRVMIPRIFPRCFLVLLLGFTYVEYGWTQSAAEYGSVTSKSTATAAGAKLSKPDMAPPAGQSQSAHLPIRTGESVAAANVRALQERAGPDATKLSLRSVPDRAQVWVNERFVGATPLDLMLAPGRYRLEMRGAGLERGRQEVEVLPKQSRVVVLSLTPRYPKKVSLH